MRLLIVGGATGPLAPCSYSTDIQRDPSRSRACELDILEKKRSKKPKNCLQHYKSEAL